MDQQLYQSIYTLIYRGITLDFYLDDYGQSIFTVLPWDNREVSFGSYNTEFAEEAKYLIDQHLDLITRDFPKKYFGAALYWFDNSGYRDIKLEYRQRILKVFLVADPDKVNTEHLKEESIQILKKVLDPGNLPNFVC